MKKLSAQQLSFIKQNRMMPIKAIASELGVSKTCVYNNINPRTLDKKNKLPKKQPIVRPPAEYTNSGYLSLMQTLEL